MRARERMSGGRALCLLASLAVLGALAGGCGSVGEKKTDAGSGGATGSGGSGGGSGGSDGGATGGGGGATPDAASGDGGDAGGGAPTITSTIPSTGGTAVNVRTVITIEFSKPMNQSSVNLTLTPAVTLTAPVWNAAGDGVTYMPSAPLASNTMYMGMVSGRDLGGVALAGTASFSFMTGAPDTTAPTVVSTSPATAATNVATSAMLSVTFSEAMDPTTVTLTIVPSVTLGEVTFNDADTVATVSGPLVPGTAYAVTIAGKDVAGNALGGTITTFMFTTAQPPDTTAPTVVSTVPSNAATGVAVQTVVAITFSEAMNQAMTSAAITITPAVTCTGGWLWNTEGTFASCQHAAALTFGIAYTVTVGTGARDLANNALAAASTFMFTTATAPDTTAPTVVSVTPAASALGVPVASNIVVNFSEPMNLASAQTAFQVIAPAGVTGTFTWSNGGATLTFNPAVNFANGTIVRFSVNMAAQDASGNGKVAVDTFAFTTIRRATVTIDCDPLVDGYIVSTPAANTTSTALIAGDLSTNLFYQSYLSFNLVLPGVNAATEAMTNIITATLQVEQYLTVGTPYATLGVLRFEHITYGATLTTAASTAAVLRTVTTAVATDGVKSVAETAAVVDDWTNRVARGRRTQFRIRFTNNTDADSMTDYVAFYSGNFATATSRPRLTVTYDYP